MTFQLDQCSNIKAFAKDCNKIVPRSVFRLPRTLINEDDPIIIKELLLKKPNPLLTMDFSFIDDNATEIPPENPGVIVVLAVPNTERIFRRFVETFKQKFPSWREIDWSQLYMEIDFDRIYVSCLIDSNIEDGEELQFDTPDFAKKCAALLAKFRKKTIKTR